MIKPLLATTLFFFFLFIFPSYAYLPINVTTSYNLGASDGNTYRIHCMNFTTIDNQIHCIITSFNKIYRTNATGALEYNCSFSGFGGYSSALMNETQVLLISATNAKTYDISQINTSTTCANTTASLPLCDDNGADIQYSLGNGYSNSILYFPSVAMNYSCSLLDATPFYSTTDTRQVLLPNMSDNTSVYTVNRGNGTNTFGEMSYYSGFALAAAYTSPNETWNVPYVNAYGSLVKVSASTTWLYYISTSGVTTNFYRMNFTALTASTNATTLSAVYPVGNLSISQTLNPTVQLNAFLDSENNGTIVWKIDNVAVGNTTISSAPISSDVFFSSQVLAAGQHYWNATFYDSLGNSWSTSTSSFFMEPTSAITTVGQSLANALGVSLDYGKMMLALLISAALSGALAYYVKWQLFLPSMIICVFFFAVAGFFPVWFTMIFIVIGGILFAKFSGLVG